MNWEKKTNEDLVTNLELWLDLDGKVQSENQVAFFKEVCWRLMMMPVIEKEKENG